MDKHEKYGPTGGDQKLTGAHNILSILEILSEAGHAKKCLMSYANNKAADHPARPRSLISTFVVRCLDSMICILTTCISKVLRF